MLCWLPQPPYAIYQFVNQELYATQCQLEWLSAR
jgi:hypothetical protein